MKNFFEREKDQFYETGYLPLLKDKFNVSNILNLSKKKVLECFDKSNAQNFLAYRFQVLKEWIKANERYNKIYVENLNYVIENLCLANELNSFENQYIEDVNSIVFAKIRNLKQLIVDFPINKGELILYRYEIKSFNELIGKNIKQHFINCDVYITNQRILISEHLNTMSISYDLINNYKFSMNRLILNLNNGKKYSIDSLDTPTIYVSLERVLKRENIFLNK